MTLDMIKVMALLFVWIAAVFCFFSVTYHLKKVHNEPILLGILYVLIIALTIHYTFAVAKYEEDPYDVYDY